MHVLYHHHADSAATSMHAHMAYSRPKHADSAVHRHAWCVHSRLGELQYHQLNAYTPFTAWARQQVKLHASLCGNTSLQHADSWTSCMHAHRPACSTLTHKHPCMHEGMCDLCDLHSASSAACLHARITRECTTLTQMHSCMQKGVQY